MFKTIDAYNEYPKVKLLPPANEFDEVNKQKIEKITIGAITNDQNIVFLPPYNPLEVMKI